MRILHIILGVSLCFVSIRSQNKIDRKDIIGRWTDITQTKNGNTNNKEYTYIFRDNFTFHIGETSNNVILFNIAGRYQIDNDSIKTVYFDFSQHKAAKAQRTSYKIESLKNDSLVLIIKDIEYEYKTILKRSR